MSRFIAIFIAGMVSLLPFVGEKVDSGDYCTLAILIAGSIIADCSLCGGKDRKIGNNFKLWWGYAIFAINIITQNGVN